MKGHNCKPCFVSEVLLVIGGLNWGLIALFDYNLVNAIFGSVAWLENLIYILVGIAAIGIIAKLMGWCKNCKGGTCKHK